MCKYAFIPGRRYYTGSPLNIHCKWIYTVVSRSGDVITLLADDGEIKTFTVGRLLTGVEAVRLSWGSKSAFLTAYRVADVSPLSASRFSL